MKEKVITSFLLKKEDRLYMKSPSPEAEYAEGVLQIQSPVCGVNFSNNILTTQVRINETETEFESTFETS